MDPTTAMYVAQGIHGLAYGMILFLVASGLNIIFGMMGILNLAHASFFMLSAYFCLPVRFHDRKFLGGFASGAGRHRFFRNSPGKVSSQKNPRSWTYGRIDHNGGSLSGHSGRRKDLLGNREPAA